MKDGIVIKVIHGGIENSTSEWELPSDSKQEAEELCDIISDIAEAFIAKWKLEEIERNSEDSL